jgi:succinate dehydrogenase hydrophobic anchor subunit
MVAVILLMIWVPLRIFLLVFLLSSCANPYVQAAAEGFLRGTMRPVTTCTTTYTSYHGRSGASTNCHTY